MKTIKILLTVLLAVFLTAVTVSAQDDAVPVEDPFAPAGSFRAASASGASGWWLCQIWRWTSWWWYPPWPHWTPWPHGPPGPTGPPGATPWKRVPEPSTLILLGIGLAAGGAYSFFRRQKSKERE